MPVVVGNLIKVVVVAPPATSVSVKRKVANMQVYMIRR